MATAIPHSAATPSHRRIELQSPADLSHLINNVSRAARARLDLHLPPIEPEKGGAAEGDGEDALRKRVGELVEGYIEETFLSASHSISINGLDASEADVHAAISGTASSTQDIEEYEPYNPNLATRLQSLHAQLERETLRLATLRADAPAAAAAAYREKFLASLAADDDVFKAQARDASRGPPGLAPHKGEEGEDGREDADAKMEDGETQKTSGVRRPAETTATTTTTTTTTTRGSPTTGLELGLALDEPLRERWSDLESTYGDAVADLGRERDGIAEARARLERAGEAVKYLRGRR
ncbi:MAG: hypothetical protein M1819_006918 [Sarea resinae]|nr:MAG: hypothetical protein M1819_006918 [Sarea resinae]